NQSLIARDATAPITAPAVIPTPHITVVGQTSGPMTAIRAGPPDPVASKVSSPKAAPAPAPLRAASRTGALRPAASARRTTTTPVSRPATSGAATKALIHHGWAPSSGSAAN